MKIGVFATFATPVATVDYITHLARTAEATGCNTLWMGEHTVYLDEYQSVYPYGDDGKVPYVPGAGVLEPMVALSFVAACTQTIGLGTAICLLPQRNPVYVANHLVSLDWVSNGRMKFGVGVGWLKEEFDALNMPWPARGKRTDDYLKVIDSLLYEDPSRFEGNFFSLPACHHFPKPVQQRLPVFIGGESDAALRRVARAGDGWIGFRVTPEALAERLDFLDRQLAAEGRSRKDVQIAIAPWTASVGDIDFEAYRALGVDELVVPVMPLSMEQIDENFARIRAALDGLGAA